MDEFFLHFLWQFQKFERKPMQLTDGSTLQVFHPGLSNPNAGPDFLEGKIRISDIEWSGSIEIHHRSSDWTRHGHQQDKKYENVILHVVWKHDTDIRLPDESILPTFQMSDFVSDSLESNYRKYINQPVTIKCASFLSGMNRLTITNMIDQALVERLYQKAEHVLAILRKHKNNWEETTFHLLARNFGFSVNANPFEEWAKSFTYSLLKRYAGAPDQYFAIAFGQAGFLEDTPVDDYQALLTREFQHLKRKHQLASHLQRHHWKFSRLRPANFPTVRMAESLSMLMKHESLFAHIVLTEEVKNLIHTLQIELPEYWKHHYDFGKSLGDKKNSLGKGSIEIFIINTVVPLLAAYSRYMDEQKYMDRAIGLLEHLRPEKNKIIREWEDCDIQPESAHDSQALLQRHKHYCQKSRCLNCNIGIAILHSGQQ